MRLDQHKNGMVNKYFSSKYPKERTLISSLFFRHGESSRICAVNKLIVHSAKKTVLDAGCGDGTALSKYSIKNAEQITLEDTCPELLEIAKNRLLEHGFKIHANCRDIFSPAGSKHDIVFAIGVLDYYQNWKDFIEILISRSNEQVIFSFPKSSHPRNWLRKVWFYLHGVVLQMFSKKFINDYFSGHRKDFAIIESDYDWIISLTQK